MLLLTNEGIYAARDKLGRTPVIIGSKDDAFAATSESCAFPNIDYQIEKYLGPGEVVFSEGELGDSLYVLASGTANVFVKDEAGHNAKVRALGDGDFFGEIALVTGGPRTATVTTAEPCEVLRLERSTVESLAERFPAIPKVVGAFAEMRSGSAEELEARLILPGSSGSGGS